MAIFASRCQWNTWIRHTNRLGWNWKHYYWCLLLCLRSRHTWCCYPLAGERLVAVCYIYTSLNIQPHLFFALFPDQCLSSWISLIGLAWNLHCIVPPLNPAWTWLIEKGARKYLSHTIYSGCLPMSLVYYSTGYCTC